MQDIVSEVWYRLENWALQWEWLISPPPIGASVSNEMIRLSRGS